MDGPGRVPRRTPAPPRDEPPPQRPEIPPVSRDDRVTPESDGAPRQPRVVELTPPEPVEERRKGRMRFLRELPGLIIVAFVLALLIKSFLLQAFFIPSQSMEPTLLIGDRVLVNKVVYNLRDPRRGEVMVFENPHLAEPDRNPLSAFWHWLTEGLGFSSDPEKDFIKRLIALPGETIEIRGGRVFIDGKRIREPYLNPLRDTSDYGPFTVEPGRYFVMGDNRANSQDSRSFLGTIPKDKIVGKAFVKIWPPSRMGWIRAG